MSESVYSTIKKTAIYLVYFSSLLSFKLRMGTKNVTILKFIGFIEKKNPEDL